ncbi:hypothetical protein [Glutamicibacter sp. ZJUTW]|uniref:hypothetical protein n=1 Tax=Glutamicibacter sp. ZJUTW TaxID=1155384 RepID=UPI0011F2EC26|nr:hypothetical protein [Glutamicibacter sp. ZJUTW]QEP08766.1 hypothetical protein F0M17_16775 [Glutamicibacter sp. ZJUTW]
MTTTEARNNLQTQLDTQALAGQGKKKPPAGASAEGKILGQSEESNLQEQLIIGIVDARLRELQRNARTVVRSGSFPVKEIFEEGVGVEQGDVNPGSLQGGRQGRDGQGVLDCKSVRDDRVVTEEGVRVVVEGPDHTPCISNSVLHEFTDVHDSSLSVDGAPGGAVGGTSESNEGSSDE